MSTKQKIRMESVIWRVQSYGRSIYGPGSGYHFVNRDRHPSDLCVFQLTMRGRLRLFTNACERWVSVGQAMLCRYGDDQGYDLPDTCCDLYEGWWFNLQGAGLASHWQWLIDQHGGVLVFDRPAVVIEEMERLESLARPHHRGDPTRSAATVYRFVMRLYEWSRGYRQQSLPPVHQAIEALRQDPLGVWTVGDLAEEYGVSREYLTRCFSDAYGVSPAVYLNQRRVDHVLELLVTTDLTIDALVDQSGFGSSHRLRRQVRERVGVTPGEYRKRYRQMSGRAV